MASFSLFSQTSLDLDLNIGSLRFPSAVSPKGLPTVESKLVDEKFSVKKGNAEIQFLESALNKANEEKKRLTEMLSTMVADYGALQNRMKLLTANSSEGESISPARKRKSADSESLDTAEPVNGRTTKGAAANRAGSGGPAESTSSDDSCKRVRLADCKPTVSKLCVRVDPSDTTLVVKDGYQWRKYGQKVTRDNPCPRAYFRCSFAPSCPVKKKVQRSAQDKAMYVATYEGEHNHGKPSQPAGAPINGSCIKASQPQLCPATIQPAPAPTTLYAQPEAPSTDSAELQRDLVEQMTVALTKDPTFKAALATAITGRMFQISPPQRT